MKIMKTMSGTGQLAAAAAALSLLAAARPAVAKDLFSIDLTVQNATVTNSGSASFNTITNAANSLTTSGIQALVPDYTQTSGAVANLFIRGLPTTASYQQGSTTLRFIVPSAGIDTSFTGATRDESQNEFKNFLLKNGGGLLTKLMGALVGSTGADPVAGNPSSLMGTSVQADFGIATGIGQSGTDPFSRAGGLLAVPNLISAGGEIGVANSGGYTSTVVTLPLRYTWVFDDPRYALNIDLPLTYVSTNGAVSAYGSLGLALRIPVAENWYIIPAVRAGLAGSEDLGSAAAQYSVGATSQYNLYVGDLKLTLGDGAGYIKTTGISVGTVDTGYDLDNAVLTNGIQAEGSLPYVLFDSPTSWQTYLTDTTFFGSKLYVSHYNEIGVTFGTRATPDSQVWNALRVGVSFAVGNHYTAYKGNFTYRF